MTRSPSPLEKLKRLVRGIVLWRFVRLFVTVFIPWIALYKARRELWVACLVIRNTARGRFPEDRTMLRWADEIEHDGWKFWKPYGGNKPNVQAQPRRARD